MTDSLTTSASVTENSPRKTPSSTPGPLRSFALVLFPWVLTGFYAVYALVGMVLEEPALLRWSYEAREVANGTLLLAVALNLPSWLYGHYHGLGHRSVLKGSSYLHLALAILLTAVVYFITR